MKGAVHQISTSLATTHLCLRVRIGRAEIRDKCKVKKGQFVIE